MNTFLYRRRFVKINLHHDARFHSGQYRDARPCKGPGLAPLLAPKDSPASISQILKFELPKQTVRLPPN